MNDERRNPVIIGPNKGGQILGMLFDKTLEKKKYLIDKLISRGIYKKNNTHLYELRLRDLEEEYHKTRSLKK